MKHLLTLLLLLPTGLLSAQGCDCPFITSTFCSSLTDNPDLLRVRILDRVTTPTASYIVALVEDHLGHPGLGDTLTIDASPTGCITFTAEVGKTYLLNGFINEEAAIPSFYLGGCGVNGLEIRND
ncbi:MAG: hypothetical protein KDC54_16750, partial [Lewinella sp.]|nr:hypothetical protein [Lewinella sp.]